MRKIIGIAMVLMMLMSVTIAFAGSAKDTQTDRKKVIIGFVDRPNQADENMIQGHGGKTRYTYDIINAKAVELPEQAIEHIKKNPRVAYVEEDAEVHALVDTLPWGVDRIDADLVWNIEDRASDVMEGGNAGAGVNVAIIDTGIDYNHPDLAGNYKGGIDFVNNDDEPMDDAGHGTHCAGIIAAEDNDAGVVGVAPEANLYAVKVLDASGSGLMSDVVAGIQWAAGKDIDVISMSLGGPSSDSLKAACDSAYDKGIVVIAAAGNSGAPRGRSTTTVDYPGAYDSVIAVSATDSSDVIAYFSSRGPEVEIAAPGVNIYSTYLDGAYATMSGTSMACPHVAGTVALIIASNPSLTNEQVRERLQDTAEDIGDPYLYGYGLVDAESAVLPISPADVHDVAIMDIEAPSLVVVGFIDVNVVVKNEGTNEETFDVILTDATDLYEIGSESVTLKAGDSATITFNWDTTDATSGDYILEATAGVVAGETDTEDNLMGTTVKVVEEAPSNIMHVAGIDMFTTIIKSKGWHTYATVLVTIADADGNPVEGASVSGQWSGLTTGTDSGITDADGVATLDSSAVKNAAGTFTFTVDDVTLDGWTYDGSANVESPDGISV
ncbi:MAG: S8 family serine peptidase [Methanosarcinaceae archaeon]|nr:S8 family serine peptidase [Methanosarcinaceae archaeon]